MIVIRDTGDPDNDPVYRCAQITTLDMKGAMPRIFFIDATVPGKDFVITVTSWKQVHKDPEVFAAVDSAGQLWRFSNALSERLAQSLAPYRNQIVQSREFVLATLT